MTPNSGQSSYISAYDMILRHDPRLMAQLCSYNPSNPVIYNPPTEDTLSANPNFLEALNSASGELESACLRGEFYAVSDLQSLTGNSLSYLKKIVSNIAMMNLYTMRDGPSPSDMVVTNYDAAMQALTDLSSGTRIFAFVQTEQAGLPETYQMNPWNQIQNRMVSSTWQRSFGIRQNMRYPYVGGYGGGPGGCYGGGGF